MQLIASGGGNILLLKDLGRNDAGCWLLVAGCWMLDNEILNFEF